MDEQDNLIQNGEMQEDISPWGSIVEVIEKDTTGHQITVALPTLDIANRCRSSIKKALEGRHVSGVVGQVCVVRGVPKVFTQKIPPLFPITIR